MADQDAGRATAEHVDEGVATPSTQSTQPAQPAQPERSWVSMAEGLDGQRFLLSRPGLSWEGWVLTGWDADGSSHRLQPSPGVVLRESEVRTSGCWRVGAEPLAALDLTVSGTSARLVGFGEPASPPLPETRDAAVVPEVGFIDDRAGRLHMSASASEARGWVVGLTDPDGWTECPVPVGVFAGRRELTAEEVCWVVEPARFGTVHLRLPEHRGVRVLVRDGRRLAH